VNRRGRRNIRDAIERVGEGRFDGAKHEVVHELRVAEPNFQLRRMRVDVHAARIDGDVHDVRRLPRLEQHVSITEPRGMAQQLVADEPIVHERVLHVGLAAGERRRRQPPAQAQAFDRSLEMPCVLHELVAAHLRHAPLLALAPASGRQQEHGPAVTGQLELDVEASEREIAQHGVDVAELRFLRFLEFPPRRRVEKEIAHLDRRAGRTSSRLGLAELAAVARDLPRVLVDSPARREREPRNRTDAWQRLAAEPHGDERFEILERGDLAGGVPRQREGQLVARDARAVVGYANQHGTATFHVDGDGPRTCVERVLDELLDDGRRALDDLAGRDLVDELRREDSNRH
jgi:hypothetical protein